MMQMLMKCSWSIMTVADKDGFDEVLPHSRWENKIKTFIAMRNTFDQDQGLTDFQAYHERQDLIFWEKMTAWMEMKNRETSGMFMNGLGRYTAATWDGWHNFKKLLHSKQFKTEMHRLKEMGVKEFFANGWLAYSSMKDLQNQGQYEAAGVAFVRNMFPDKQEAMESDVKWDPMPGSNSNTDKLEGLVTGMIKSFTGEENRDEIAYCISDYDDLMGHFRAAGKSAFHAYNDDVMDSVNGVVSLIQGLDQNVANCPDKTKRQVADMQAKVERHAPYDKAKIIGALDEHKSHAELKLMEMHMFFKSQEYENLGESFGDFFLTLASN